MPLWNRRGLILALGVLASGTIAWLTAENLQLKAALARVSLPEAPATDELDVGEALPDSALVEVVPGGAEAGQERATGDLVKDVGVVFFFTTRCPYCARSFPYVGRLAALLEADRLPVVGIALDGQAERYDALVAAGLQWRIFAPKDLRSAAELRIRGVPTTVLLGADGRVTRIWRGVLDDAIVEDIRVAARASADIN